MTAKIPSTDHTVAKPPYIEPALEGRLEAVSRHAFEVAKFETAHLSPVEPLTAEMREIAIRKIAEGLRFWYIDADMGEKMAQEIERNLERKKYDVYTNPFSFKEKLVDDLRAVCPDKHIDIRYCLKPISPHDPSRILADLKTEDLTAAQRKVIEDDDAEIQKELQARPWIYSGIIKGTSIGYVRIDLFPSHEYPITRKEIARAMGKIALAKTLIIDLTKNGGGAPHTVAMVASHLFDRPTPLSRLYQRSTNETEEFHTVPKSGAFGGDKPICVLTSSETFSGGEALAYDLQSLGRASVIGQRTKGGAHPITNYVIHDHLYISIPYKRARNPYTDTNWERRGVIPDHSIPPNVKALDVAVKFLSRN